MCLSIPLSKPPTASGPSNFRLVDTSQSLRLAIPAPFGWRQPSETARISRPRYSLRRRSRDFWTDGGNDGDCCSGAPVLRHAGSGDRAPACRRGSRRAAQSDRGGITGRVSDPQKAVVAGAKVVARDVETGTEHRTITTSTGDYTLSSLPARTLRR